MKEEMIWLLLILLVIDILFWNWHALAQDSDMTYFKHVLIHKIILACMEIKDVRKVLKILKMSLGLSFHLQLSST